ncbi:unnamed protein product [Chondrus crispus]|uniref:Uncharacterized protein n=1 Tax=Chondrus crispus TaxID=2769 RepID=R7QDN3_CHOCR|nr:unnamed protein product [Chondrus crispus]CDF36622.1 unnamed protein product [Chondrus crispus]|eukprot:XP_005716441.1 unnamed protein product [Chondrus crispus]
MDRGRFSFLRATCFNRVRFSIRPCLVSTMRLKRVTDLLRLPAVVKIGAPLFFFFCARGGFGGRLLPRVPTTDCGALLPEGGRLAAPAMCSHEGAH